MKTLTRDNPLEYRGYLIFQGSNHLKYDFIHKEYDGADDAFDPRCGGANTIEDCIAYIDEIEEEEDLKPFDIEKAKAGHPVVTREGQSVRTICFDMKNTNYPIVALISDGETEYPLTFTSDGKFDGSTSPNDLFMEP